MTNSGPSPDSESRAMPPHPSRPRWSPGGHLFAGRYLDRRYPELARLANEHHRSAAVQRFREITEHSVSWPRHERLIVGVAIGFIMVRSALSQFNLLPAFLGSKYTTVIALTGLLICGYATIRRRSVIRDLRRREIRKFLCQKNLPTCIECGYDLGGVSVAQTGSLRCPECGATPKTA